MGLENIQAVQSRIAELRVRIGVVAATGAPAAAPAGAGTTAANGVSFDAALASALGPTATSNVGGPATVRSPGDYGRLTPPAELTAYGNGQVPRTELVAIGDGSEQLNGPAAQAFRTMAADAWQAGVDLRVSDGYRSLDEQHELADRLGLYRDGGLAAVPGTSNHGWGLSVDIDTDGGALEWMRANAARYGFVEDVPREPWHWTYRPDPA